MGEEGNIALNIGKTRPPGLFKEYWKDKDIMERAFRGDYYFTGDRGFKDEDGYFWFVGRDDDVIKSSGNRIGPFEVESALIEHPAVQECAVVGAPDPEGVRGIVVKAFVVLVQGYKPSEALTRELQEHVKKTTAPYKYPRLIEYMEELPKTITGKDTAKGAQEELKKQEPGVTSRGDAEAFSFRDIDTGHCPEMLQLPSLAFSSILPCYCKD